MKVKFTYLKFRGILRKYLSKKISKSAFLGRNTQLLGIQNIEIGQNTSVGENGTFTVNDREKLNTSLSIGNNCFLGRNLFFAVGKSIEIGDYCIFGNNCTVVCSDHSFDTPLVPYRISGVTLNKSIKIGVNCWLGINVTIIGDVNIGHGSIIGANTVVTKDVPPFSLVVGNPSKIIKRFNFSRKEWTNDYEVGDTPYLDEQEYLKHLKSSFGLLPIAYHASSSQFGHI